MNDRELEKVMEEVAGMGQHELTPLLQVVLSNSDFDSAIEIVKRWLERNELKVVEAEPRAEVPGACKHEYEYSNYCGADVCVNCGEHKNLARCFCGWNLAPGERLDDDIGEGRFDGKYWHVDY